MSKILLFIPMYNCERQIPRVLAQLTDEVCAQLSEVIVVNNRSTDGGEDAVRGYLADRHMPLPVTLLRNDENYGLGGSHKVAFAYAIEHGFDYVVVLHGDDQGELSNLLPHFRSGAYRDSDCFLGARFMKGSRLQGYSTFRTVGNKVFNLLFSAGVGRMVYDLGSGLNLYRVAALESGWYLRFKDNMIFNDYMLPAAIARGLRVKFFPIRWREEDQVSNVKMVKNSLEVLDILRMYLFDRKGLLEDEHRDRVIAAYTALEIWPGEGAEG